MNRSERQQNILRFLAEADYASVTVKKIADTLFYSESSVRRDVRGLEQQGLVRHAWGSVTLSSGRDGIVPARLREDEHSDKKRKIAERAAAFVHDGDTVIMDSSSTVRRMLPYLAEKRGLRIITNNLRLFEEELPKGFRLYCTGGSFRPENHNFCGAAAETYLRTVRADSVFFSSQGLNENGEISDISEEETALRRVMLSVAEKKYFLCDSSKIGITRQFVLCTVDDVDGVIGDDPIRIAGITKK